MWRVVRDAPLVRDIAAETDGWSGGANYGKHLRQEEEDVQRLLGWRECLLVSSGYHNQISSTGRLGQHRSNFSQFWRLEASDQSPTGSVFGADSLPGFAAGRLLTMSSHGGESELWFLCLFM